MAFDGDNEFFDPVGGKVGADHAALGEEVEFDSCDAVEEVPAGAFGGVVFVDFEAFPQFAVEGCCCFGGGIIVVVVTT